MDDKRRDQTERIAKRYAHLIEMQTGKAVRPYRADGYMNMMNKYGTSKDVSERYQYHAEPAVPDELLTMYYEGNGLFAKIIDTPAEEAIKHGFKLDSTKDQRIEDFYTEALDELDWEETAMTAIRWARLFGGSIAVMLINDGRGIDEPLDWRNIRSIDDIRVYDRSVIQPDYQSMFSYDPQDPFRTRGSRLGMPEFYHVTSRTGSFTVHDSRCLVFQNGILPENTTNSIYQLWGIPEYVRINRAIRDAEVAHGSATKLLDRSVQAVYKMKDLAAELATEEGEDRVLRRLQTIDMARGLLNSITIDSEGEDYDFRQFQFSGVSDVIDSTCNFLSALTSIPQTILFGRSPAGMNATGDADLENWYNYLERIQKRMVKKNLRYLLSVIFQAGVRTGEVDEVPKIKIEFNPLWSLSDSEQADLDQKRAQTQYTKAQTAQVYIDKQVIDPSEVRAKLADSEEFDVENMLDEYEDEDLFPEEPTNGAPVSGDVGQGVFEQGQLAQYAEGVDIEEHNTDPSDGAPSAAPAATKLPQDMSDEEKAETEENAPEEDPEKNTPQKPVNAPQSDSTDYPTSHTPRGANPRSVGVLVISDGKILSGTRHNDFGYGLICGPGGHIEDGETPEQAAFRETEEEFGISPKELIPLGLGPKEPDTGLTPYLFLCTDFEGEPECLDLEMSGAKFRTIEELEQLAPSMFQPFADGVALMKAIANGEAEPDGFAPFDEDGGPGSGNFGHEGREGAVGGSAPSGSAHKKYASEESYRSAKSKAKASMVKWLESIDASYEEKRKEIDEKYGSRLQRRIAVKTDGSLTNAQKEEKLAEIDADFERRSEEQSSLYEQYGKDRDAADTEYRSIFEPDYEYDRIDRRHSIADDGQKNVINPEGLSMNCQRCAIAFEMRRRGYNVSAAKGEGDGLGYASNIVRCFINPETNVFSGNDSQKITTDVQEQMIAWGEGSRAVVAATFNEGYAHAFNLCVDSGEVKVVDSQIGAIWSDKTSVEAGGRVNLGLDDAVNVLVIRSDTAQVGISTEDYVRRAE